MHRRAGSISMSKPSSVTTLVEHTRLRGAVGPEIFAIPGDTACVGAHQHAGGDMVLGSGGHGGTKPGAEPGEHPAKGVRPYHLDRRPHKSPPRWSLRSARVRLRANGSRQSAPSTSRRPCRTPSPARSRVSGLGSVVTCVMRVLFADDLGDALAHAHHLEQRLARQSLHGVVPARHRLEELELRDDALAHCSRSFRDRT